jgi:hypothetical protein
MPRVVGYCLVFGSTEKVTVVGKVLPLPPETIVTPSPGIATYEQDVPVAVTVKLPVPPLAGMVVGDRADRVSGHGLAA